MNLQKRKQDLIKSGPFLKRLQQHQDQLIGIVFKFEKDFVKKNQLNIIAREPKEYFLEIKEIIKAFDGLINDISEDLLILDLISMSDRIKKIFGSMGYIITFLQRKVSQFNDKYILANKNLLDVHKDKNICDICGLNLEQIKLKSLERINIQAVVSKKQNSEGKMKEKQRFAENEKSKSKFDQEVNQQELDSFVSSKFDQFIEAVNSLLHSKAVVQSRKPADTERVLKDIIKLFSDKDDKSFIFDQVQKSQFLKKFANSQQLVSSINNQMIDQLISLFSQNFYSFCLKLANRLAMSKIDTARSNMKQVAVQTNDPKSKQNLRALQGKIESLLRDLESRKNKVHQLEKEKVNFMMRQRNLEKQVSDNSSNLEKFRADLRQSESQNASLRAKIAKDRGDHDAEITTLKTQLISSIQHYRNQFLKKEKQCQLLKSKMKIVQTLSRVTQTYPKSETTVGISTENMFMEMLKHNESKIVKYQKMLRELGKKDQIKRAQQIQRRIKETVQEAKVDIVQKPKQIISTDKIEQEQPKADPQQPAQPPLSAEVEPSEVRTKEPAQQTKQEQVSVKKQKPKRLIGINSISGARIEIKQGQKKSSSKLKRKENLTQTLLKNQEAAKLNGPKPPPPQQAVQQDHEPNNQPLQMQEQLSQSSVSEQSMPLQYQKTEKTVIKLQSEQKIMNSSSHSIFHTSKKIIQKAAPKQHISPIAEQVETKRTTQIMIQQFPKQIPQSKLQLYIENLCNEIKYLSQYIYQRNLSKEIISFIKQGSTSQPHHQQNFSFPSNLTATILNTGMISRRPKFVEQKPSRPYFQRMNNQSKEFKSRIFVEQQKAAKEETQRAEIRPSNSNRNMLIKKKRKPGFNVQFTTTPRKQYFFRGSKKVKKRSPSSDRMLFDVEDLELFGGISQAYNYQNNSKKNSTRSILKGSEERQLDNEEVDYIKNVFAHIQVIRLTNHSLYSTLKNFIKFPFQSIVYRLDVLDLTDQLSYQTFFKVMTAFLNFHNSCKDCQHINRFLQKIGYMKPK